MRLFVIIVVIFAGVVLAVQNASAVSVQFFFWQGQASLALIVTLCFAIGALLSLLVSMPRIYRMRAHERSLRDRIAQLEAAQGSPIPPEPAPGAGRAEPKRPPWFAKPWDRSISKN